MRLRSTALWCTLLVVAVVVAGVLPASPATAQEAARGTITGSVVDDLGQVPAYACVATEPEDNGVAAGHAITQVDAAGRYSLSVPPGRYALTVGGCGQRDIAHVYRGGGDSRAASPPVDVTAGSSSDVPMVLPRAATVSGTVRYEDGAPAAGQCVQVHDSVQPNIFRNAVTDAEGEYTVVGVSAGLRRVHFGDCEGRAASYGSWYARADSYQAATPLDIAPAAATVGIDGTVRRLASLTGRVVDDTGAPVAGACAQLASATGSSFTGFSACTDADGRWRIDQLRPSAYIVRITRGTAANADLVERYWPGVGRLGLAVPVVVSEDVELPVVDVVLPRGARVTGRVTGSDGSPVAGACVDVRDVLPGGEAVTAITAADGSYAARGVDAGAHTVFVRRCSAGNWAPRYHGTQDGSAPTDGLVLALGDRVDGIDVVMERGATITGRVLDPQGAPVAGACVGVMGGPSGGSTSTAADGRWTVDGLSASEPYLWFRDCRGRRLAQEYSGDTPFPTAARRYALPAGASVDVGDTVLEVAGTVSGTVTDARTGRPVGGVGVALQDADSARDTVYGSTDGNGVFRVEDARPGRYVVAFYDVGANLAVPEYWDDALLFRDAEPVVVVAGADRGGVDADVLLLTVPSVPTLPEVLPGVTDAVVSWEPPLADGSAPVTAYEVVDTATRVLTTVGGEERSAVVTGLEPGRSYELAVRAVNRKGAGPATAPLLVTTRPRSTSGPTPRPTTSAPTSPVPTSTPTPRPVPTAAPTPGTSPAPVASVRRLAGSDRIATALAIGRDSHPAAASADTVVLARADAFADALAGGPLAVDRDAPLLLTGRDRLDDRVAAELRRVLRPGGTVLLLGGPAALSTTVEQQVRALGAAVTRFAGADRYATAVRIAEAVGPGPVLLADGTGFADALAASSAAGRLGGSVLLTNGPTLPLPTARHLAARSSPRYAVGGPAAAADPSAVPLVGRDRYATAARVASALLPPATSVGLASGAAFPDALAGGVHAARRGAVLLLTGPDALHPATAGLLSGQRLSAAWVYGGVQAVRPGVVDQLGSLLP